MATKFIETITPAPSYPLDFHDDLPTGVSFYKAGELMGYNPLIEDHDFLSMPEGWCDYLIVEKFGGSYARFYERFEAMGQEVIDDVLNNPQFRDLLLISINSVIETYGVGHQPLDAVILDDVMDRLIANGVIAANNLGMITLEEGRMISDRYPVYSPGWASAATAVNYLFDPDFFNELKIAPIQLRGPLVVAGLNNPDLEPYIKMIVAHEYLHFIIGALMYEGYLDPTIDHSPFDPEHEAIRQMHPVIREVL
jgi:hypothetical protein